MYVVVSKAIKKVVLWGIRGYHRMHNVTHDVSQRPTTL